MLFTVTTCELCQQSYACVEPNDTDTLCPCLAYASIGNTEVDSTKLIKQNTSINIADMTLDIILVYCKRLIT